MGISMGNRMYFLNGNSSPSKLWMKLKYSLEFIDDFQIFGHFKKPGSLQIYLMPRSMLSKLNGRCRILPDPETPYFMILCGVLSLEMGFSTAFCCPNCSF